MIDLTNSGSWEVARKLEKGTSLKQDRLNNQQEEQVCNEECANIFVKYL